MLREYGIEPQALSRFTQRELGDLIADVKAVAKQHG